MNVNNFFQNYLTKDSIFLDKSLLLSSYAPEEIMYRENLIQDVANILAPSLRVERPSSLLVYGKTGTGKTLSIKYVLKSIERIAADNSVPLKTIYVNCKLKRIADTEYRLIAQLIKELGKDVPPTGLPTDEVYNIFYTLIDNKKQIILLALDEIDQLTSKVGDLILYNLTRINAELKNAQIALVGISNNLIFAENLDPRVRSSLSEEEIIFPSYNALQIQDILRKRSDGAFRENVVEVGVIEKCAAYAAREHGDARRAIDLLRVAGELAERYGSEHVTVNHLDEAESKIETDKIIHAVTTQPKQFQLVLYSILVLHPQNTVMFTGEIYDIYQKLCKQVNFNVLTQRRISDMLAEFDMLGIINAKIISKGRYGRTREISLGLDGKLLVKLKELIEKSLQIHNE